MTAETRNGPKPGPALALRERMARRENGVIAGFGVKLRPSMNDAKLTPPQAEIFHRYGYPRKK